MKLKTHKKRPPQRQPKGHPMRKLMLLTAAAALTGCNMAPRYRQPVAPVAAQWPQTGATTAAGAPLAAELGWQDFFADPRLRAYVAAALANNRDLAQSVARVAQARARYRIEDSQRLPQVAGTASAMRTRTPLSVLRGGQNDAGGQDTTTYNSFNVGVSIPSYEMDFWGRLRNLSDAARARYLGTIEAERAFRLSLIAQVAATYVGIRAAEDRIALAERSVETRREGLKIARQRLDAGVTSTIDYDQSALLVTQAETELADLRRTHEQAINLLTLLVGGPIAGPLPDGLPFDRQQLVSELNPGLPSALLASRPDIAAAEYQLRAANADIGAARAAFFPLIALTASFGFISTDLDRLFDSQSKTWTYGGGGGPLPLLDWGARSANLRLTKAQRDEMVANYQKTVQQAFREVADGLVARQRYAEQIVAQTRAVAAQKSLADASHRRYDNGIAIYLEVLDAERNLFAAEQQLLALRAADLQNSISLFTALGGGRIASRAGATQAAPQR
jgi:multidrug efflux system outer membrane protein